MSTITNKFFVQFLEDGSTLHGQLLATITPTQSYKDGQFIPNWSTTAAARPLIYLSLQNGSTDTEPDSDYVWKYNGTIITFSSTKTSVTIGEEIFYGYASSDGKFFKTGTNSTNLKPLDGMPALGIIGNLASSSNVDIDVIRFEGSKTFATNPVKFSCSLNVTITQWTAGGYLGVLIFENGNVITRDLLTINCEAKLYNDNGPIYATNYTCKWYREGIDTSTPWKTSTIPDANGKYKITINEADVTDYMVLRCDFCMTINEVETVVYSAFGNIDDQQDPEYMWIKYDGANGNSASLRDTQSVVFNICVGTADDDTPIQTGGQYVYTSFKVKLLASDGTTIKSTQGTSGSVLTKAVDGNGYRTLDVSNGVATATVFYADKNYCKNGLTGIVVAQSAA